MASVNNAWTVASGKKSKPQNASPSTKGKKKPFVEGMPRIQPNAPVEESPTIYSVFMQDEEKKEQKLEKERLPPPTVKPTTSVAAAVSGGGKKGLQTSKKLTEKKKDKPVTLEEALAEVEITELETVLAKDKVTFPDNPDVWLKDLASVLNLRLDKLQITDPTFADKPTNYPICLLPKNLKTFLSAVLSKSSVQTLRVFLDHCIESMIADSAKGFPTYGFHLFVQLLLHLKPEIGIQQLPAYVPQLKENINRPQRALCILWSLGQAGFTDLGNGVKVWLELMLPILNIRSLATYAVHYLESLFRLHPNAIDSAHAAFPKREFFKLFDELFSPRPALSSELRNRMLQLYPQLKMVAFGCQPEKQLHNFFTSFLSRCSSDCHGAKKTELLSCLVTCLLVDKQSFSTWRQIYVKHIAQSSILLQYLADNLEGTVSQIDRTLLRETVRAFHVTNEDLSSNASNVSPDFNVCVSSCQDLLHRLSRFQSPSRWLLALILIILAVAFSIDIFTSRKFTDCRTYRALESAGIVHFMHQAWLRLCLYSNKVSLWLTENVPIYCSKTLGVVQPYVMLVYEKSVLVITAIIQALRPACHKAIAYASTFITWLNAKLPWILQLLETYISHVMNFILWLYQSTMYSVRITSDWLLSNVLIGSWSPENILQTISVMLSHARSYIISSYRWLANVFMKA